MSNLTVTLKKTRLDTPDPVRAHASDVGMDLVVMGVEQHRNNVFMLDMGVSVSPPEGCYMELHCRSSIFKTDFMLANKVGIIDPGYTGTIFMPVRYLGEGDGMAAANDLVGKRFGQLILRRHEAFDVEVVSELASSERGTAGLGSSGV